MGMTGSDMHESVERNFNKQLAETRRMLVRLDCIMHHIEEDENMAYQAIVKKLPACTGVAL